MKNDDDYYRQVEQELKRGIFQEGLTTRAIAETNGDENKAKALYIKLRIESLRKEAIEETRKAKEQELQAKELEKQERLAELKIELKNLASVSRTRRLIKRWGEILFSICSVFIGFFFLLLLLRWLGLIKF